MRKKLITGAAVLALLMNAPHVSADDDIVIFGGEFEDETIVSAPKKVETPEPKPPVEKPKPEVVKPQEKNKPEVVKPQEKDKPEVVKPQEKDKPEVVTPQEKNKPEIIEPQDKLPAQSFKQQQEIEEPTEQSIVEEPIESPSVEPLHTVEKPFEQPTNIRGGQELFEEPIIEREPTRRYFSSSQQNQPQQNLKTIKPRFIKLAVDDTYTYYLDKTSVQWKKIPYLANEYMADVWIRMIERDPAPLDDNMANYGAENFRAEVALAREQGYQYSPEDLKVLRSQAYVLEHYYIRPKTKQIQFLCELEVFGRPQNAINERAYDNKNWENLVPGSVESVIYDTTIKIIGKSKATERGHMTFIDMLDEYARIALN